MKIARVLSLLRPYHLALLTLGLLFFLPFSMVWRVGPQPGFFLEAIALALLLLMILGSAASGLLPRKPPAASWWLLAFAVFFPIQSITMQLPYPGYTWLMCWLLLALALAAWALAGLRQKVGFDTILTVIATALLMAVLWQSFVCWMQFFGLTDRFYGLMMHAPAPHYVFGQLGQRNHLGHFMFWGLLAACYLFAERRLSPYLSIFSLLVITLTLGLIGSRTILLYIAVLLPICIFYLMSRPAQRRMALMIIASLIAVFLAQWLLPQVSEDLLHIGLQSGLERAADGGGETASRLHEWHKAWLVFLDHPWLGKGWMGYADESLDKGKLFAFHEIPHPGVLFTHCHNLLLQLLAEIGLIGTLLLCGGSLWLMRHLFRLPAHNGILLLGGALSVSLIHSLLEYPLWYVYFFLPFFVLLILVAIPESPAKQAPSAIQWVVGIVICAALAVTVYQCLQYSRLMQLNTRTTANQCAEHAGHLHRFARQNIYLAYYADAASTQCLGAVLSRQSSTQLPWLRDTLYRTARFRPFPTQAVQWGMQQAYDGDIAAAQDWLHAVWQYYPQRIPQDHAQIKRDETLAPLLQTAQSVQDAAKQP